MISFSKPTYAQFKEFLWQHQEVPFTYQEVGATRGEAPGAYTCGRKRIQLGLGRECYLEAKEALKQWKMFPHDFAELIWPISIEVGGVVATLFRAPFFWTSNPCRIVYTIDELVAQENQAQGNEAVGQVERFGFAYGTVGRHLASGEERFTVEYHHGDESVWYEVYCFSRVNHWLSVMAYPYFRLQQHRFRARSAQAMKNAVTKTANSPGLASLAS